MKRHYFIYLFLMCLITTSCENTVFEEEIPATAAVTRSTPEELGYYGSNFRNIVVRTSQFGSDETYAYLNAYPANGSEYSCTLYSELGNEGVKSLVSIAGGTVIYNGITDNRIYGVDGQIKFTIRTSSPNLSVSLKFETPYPTPIDSRVSARLIINSKKYNGETLPSVSGGFPDLNITAFYGGVRHDAKVEWICNTCGNWNNDSQSVCTNCGKNKGSY